MNPTLSVTLRIFGGIIVVALLLVFANYAAGGLFLIVHKINPANHFPYSALDAWEHYQAFPQYAKSLKGSSIAGVAASLGLVFFGYSAVAGSKRSVHGQARYARTAEIRAAGLMSDAGIILAKLGGDYLTLGGQQFVVLAAPTRSGKGAGVVIPNLLTYDGSAVVLDIKKENWATTAGFRAQHGQAVYLFDPFSTHTHRQNPLSYISESSLQRVSDASAIAMALYPDPPRGDPFWQQQARNLALGLILMLIETPELPCTIGEMARQATGKSKTLPDHLNHIISERAALGTPLSTACQDCLYRFMSNAENTLSSILSALNAPLSLWTNPLVDAATSASDFDWRQLRRKKMSVYIAVKPGHLAEAAFLINIMMTQLINVNTDVVPEADSTLKHQALLIMDEFTAFGKMPIFERAAGYMAGFNLRLLLIIQSTAQLKSVYGEDATKTILDNSAAQIVFPPKDIKEAQMVSETLGYLGQLVASKGVSHSAGGMQRGSSRSRSENTSEQRRALLLPQEVRELPSTTALIFAEYLRPVLAQKIRWFDDPHFKDRKLAAPPVPALNVMSLLAAIESRSPHALHTSIRNAEDSTIESESTDADIDPAAGDTASDTARSLSPAAQFVSPASIKWVDADGLVHDGVAATDAVLTTHTTRTTRTLINLEAVFPNAEQAIAARRTYAAPLSTLDIEAIAESVFDCFERINVLEAVGEPLALSSTTSPIKSLTPVPLIQGL
jgi:type IV secretion system protein VirD4